MSDQGWHDFLAADGVDDWFVLHGGATAVFASCRWARRRAWHDAIDGDFWRAVLGYIPMADDNAVHPLGRSPTARATAFVFARGQMGH